MLRSECPPEQAERVLQLKQLCREDETSDQIIDLIAAMDLSEAIAAAGLSPSISNWSTSSSSTSRKTATWPP